MRAGAGRALGQAGRVVGHPAATGWLGSLAPSKAKQLALFWSNFTNASSRRDRCTIDSGIENSANSQRILLPTCAAPPDAEAKKLLASYKGTRNQGLQSDSQVVASSRSDAARIYAGLIFLTSVAFPET